MRHQCIAERPEFDFVIVARIQQCQRATSSSQRFSSFGGSLGDGFPTGSTPSTPKLMISLLILTSIRLNGW